MKRRCSQPPPDVVPEGALGLENVTEAAQPANLHRRVERLGNTFFHGDETAAPDGPKHLAVGDLAPASLPGGFI